MRNDFYQGSKLLKEAIQILKDQVSDECPACDAKGATSWPIGEKPPFPHTEKCVIRRGLFFLGKEEGP